LLLLHGFGGARSNWQPLQPQLAPQLHSIAIDCLGHGDSDCPAAADSYRMAAVAADMVDLLAQLGLGRAHLLGYSMGGRLALYMALRYGDRFRSLTLESASPGLRAEAARRERQQADEWLAAQIEARGIAWFVDYWERLPLWASQAGLSPSVRAAQRRQRLRNQPRGLAHCLRAMGSGVQPDLWAKLCRLQLPTLLLVGAADAKFSAINAAMAAQIPSSQLQCLPGAGHNCHLEQPQAFARAVLDFCTAR